MELSVNEKLGIIEKEYSIAVDDKKSVEEIKVLILSTSKGGAVPLFSAFEQ